MLPAEAYAQEKTYKIKAVFLFKFFKYIQWPEGQDVNKVICVYGANSFGNALDYIVQSKFAAAGYAVRYIDDTHTIGGCALLFIGHEEAENIPTVLTQMQYQTGLLTVSDHKGFAKQGGGIEFVNTPKKIVLLLNTESFKRHGLVANSKLMQIVKTVP